jgi:hypothetical protein
MGYSLFDSLSISKVGFWLGKMAYRGFCDLVE